MSSLNFDEVQYFYYQARLPAVFVFFFFSGISLSSPSSSSNSSGIRATWDDSRAAFRGSKRGALKTIFMERSKIEFTLHVQNTRRDLGEVRDILRLPFLGYNVDTALNWLATQKICGLNSPLGVDPASNLTYGEPPNTVSVNAGCASGNTYTVKAGDTCESIAVANSVAQGTLWAINNLSPDCSAMTVGQSLCLPKQCDLYTLERNDTCWSIASAKGLSFSSILGYNPTISPDCSNLNATGSVICVSNPQGNFAPPPSNGTNPNAQNQFATAVVPAPGPTPFGTTAQCGGFYQVQVADTCQRISLAAGVSVDLFEEINPSIDANCFNLITGLWYCVHPLGDWNSTSAGNSSMPSTTVPPPAPTPPGTTGSCFEWHVVVSGDTCSLLQETLGVTMAHLVLWNPNLAANCSNLLLGEAYCVAGPTDSTTTTILATKTSKATSAPTTAPSAAGSPTSTTGICGETYTVKSGDTCFAIWTEFGLTEAQLLTLNPTVDSNCDIQVGQVLCVSGTGTASTTAAAPASSGTSTTCPTRYTVKSGDFCFAIWTQFGLTEDQFLAMNPSLDSNCDIQVGEVLCV
ncbi:hypothetical protein BGZ57DRAFT_993033 [Hyaloscypha finlandica]|nr:hypothetical protein BGZ57DRAFT_993033 [Hyaloscypha finlandica]